jgi:acetolactate synthase I/II/III large subunit
LPEEVAAQTVEGWPLTVRRLEYPRPADHAIETAGKLIERAERPMILAGNGVVRRRATAELRRFAETVGIPAANTFMSKGVMGYKHPLARLTVGLQNRDYEMCGLADADLVIAVGYDLVEFSPRLWNPGRHKRIIHVDTLAAEVDEYYQPEVEIVSELGEALKALTDCCGHR